MLKRAERELERLSVHAPRVSIVIDQLRTIIAGYRSILVAVAALNPDQYMAGNPELYSEETYKTKNHGTKAPVESMSTEPVKAPPGYKVCNECGNFVRRYAFQEHLKSGHVLGIRQKESTEKSEPNPTPDGVGVESTESKKLKKTTTNGKWDAEKERFLLEHHMDMSPYKIGQALGLAGTTIIYHLKQLGLRDSLKDHVSGGEVDAL